MISKLENIPDLFKLVIKGFVIFAIPPTVIHLLDLMLVLDLGTFLYLVLRDSLAFGTIGALMGLAYECVIKKITKSHIEIAKIVIGIYYVLFLTRLVILLYLAIVIGNITP